MVLKHEYAAVAIPTLNRYEHLKRCIESLTQSPYAKNTDLYIGVDYPPDDRYFSGWREVNRYIDEGIVGFNSVYIYKHETNLGVGDNIEYILNQVRQSHNMFILSEDDNEFSVDYLEYMNGLLTRYRSDEDVLAVSGYNYPINFDVKRDLCYSNNVYFAAFGFGSWLDKFDRCQTNMTRQWLYDLYYDRSEMSRLVHIAPNQYCNFVKGMLGYTTALEKDNEVWKMDLTYGLFMFSHDKKMIFPLISKVRNWGYDGSGINCDVMDYDPNKPITHRNFGFDCQKLDERLECGSMDLASDSENKAILDRVNVFFRVPTKEVLKCHLAYVVSRIVGIGTMRKIWKK